jgi:hypothetical protein
MSKDKPRREARKPKKSKAPKLPASSSTPTPLVTPIRPASH